MAISRAVGVHLIREAVALRERLRTIMPFDLYMTMVPAAAISLGARRLVNEFVRRGQRDLNDRLADYLRWLKAAEGPEANDESAQRRLTMIRLRANTMISRFDLYADALSQRSEHRVGTWLAGLECVATDALEIDDPATPPVVCYLDHGSGAAIRRARTRLPGGELNPVALVRIPRERMIGSGVGSSLVHEVGHQGVEMLGVLASIRPVLKGLESTSARAWPLWSRWITEILPDFWSVARVGPTAVMGLISVVSVPRAFVFRVSTDDPHPPPWIRVRLACAMANDLYPDPQWSRIDAMWRRLYPMQRLDTARMQVFDDLSATLSALARLVAEHRPRALRGRTLREALCLPAMLPADLAGTFERWRADGTVPEGLRPCHVLAVLGQAKLEGRIDAAQETRALENLLSTWALRRARLETDSCARRGAAA